MKFGSLGTSLRKFLPLAFHSEGQSYKQYSCEMSVTHLSATIYLPRDEMSKIFLQWQPDTSQ
jgi:hypothetical protein